jgi:hypothetical protein
MKASLLRVTGSVASIASTLVLFGGVASAQSTTNATISDTGDRSKKVIEINEKCEVTINNENHVVIINHNDQNAESGDAVVGGGGDAQQTSLNEEEHEGEGGNVGDVTTGDATNTNETGINVNIDNSANITCFVQQQQPTPPAGGQGAGAPVTPAAQPVGGRGAAETVFVPVQQVASVPVGGVGAGTGGVEYLSGLAAITLLSGAWATRRLHKSFKSQS